MGTAKHFIGGFFWTLFYITMTLIIPYFTLEYLTSINVAGYPISYVRSDFDNMIKWILRLGIIVCACGFFKKTAPKGSRRMAWFGLFQTIANLTYIYMYKYGGATEILITFEFGFASIGVALLLYLVMGRLALNSFFNIYNIIYNTFFYKDKKEKEKEDKIKEEDKPDELINSDEIKFKKPNSRTYFIGCNLAFGTITLITMLQNDIFTQFSEYISIIAVILGNIIEYLKIVLMPLGLILKNVIQELSFYLVDMDIVYIVICVIIIIAAFIVNIIWSKRTKKRTIVGII